MGRKREMKDLVEKRRRDVQRNPQHERFVNVTQL
jgi:hypothetical protein